MENVPMNDYAHNASILVLSDELIRWDAQERADESIYHNGVESWIFAFGEKNSRSRYCGVGICTNHDIATADIVIANAHYTRGEDYLQMLCNFAESRPATTKWVTLIEGDALDHIVPLPNLQRLFHASDTVNCINPHTLDLYRKYTSSPVEYIGCPYPLHAVRSYRVSSSQRKDIFLCANLRKRTNDYMVGKALSALSAHDLYAYENMIPRKIFAHRYNYMNFIAQMPMPFCGSISTHAIHGHGLYSIQPPLVFPLLPQSRLLMDHCFFPI
jgi:hypothetical protein